MRTGLFRLILVSGEFEAKALMIKLHFLLVLMMFGQHFHSNYTALERMFCTAVHFSPAASSNKDGLQVIFIPSLQLFSARRDQKILMHGYIVQI